jgi:hypothetical protein
MSVEDKTKFIIAIRNYKCTKTEKHSDRTDTTVLNELNEKILLRSIEPECQNGFIGIDDVKKMMKIIKLEDYNKGILISKHFTVAAVQEMKQENIQQVSDEYMPPFETEKLYLTINNCINNQCKAKCGEIHSRKSDCKGNQKSNLCKIRALSDNALFHFEQGWVGLMKNDLKLVLAVNKF